MNVFDMVDGRVSVICITVRVGGGGGSGVGVGGCITVSRSIFHISVL